MSAFLKAAIVAFPVVAFLSRKPVLKLANQIKFQPYFRNAEKANRLPAGLLEAIAKVESNFRDDIINGQTISPAGAVGLMQIIPKWHPGINPLDPIASINYAGKYVRELYNKTGSWKAAVAAYNWGIGNVQRYGINNLPTETRNYISKVFSEIS